MGMFTWVEGAPSGPVQVKFGDDTCDTLRVGSVVHWRPEFYAPGEGVDGVYHGRGGALDTMEGDAAVVVRDATIVAVVPHPFSGPSLRAEHRITDPDPTLWPDEAWDRERRQAHRGKRAQLAQEIRFRRRWRAAAGRREAVPKSDAWAPSFDTLLRQHGFYPSYNEHVLERLAAGTDPLLMADEEQAVLAHMARDSASEFTRSVMRQDGFMRQLMSTWADVPEELPMPAEDIVALVERRLIGWDWPSRPAVRRAWQDHWHRVGNELRTAAATWAAEEALRQRRLLQRIEGDKKLLFHVEWLPSQQTYRVSLRRNLGLQPVVGQEGPPGDGPVKIVDPPG